MNVFWNAGRAAADDGRQRRRPVVVGQLERQFQHARLGRLGPSARPPVAAHAPPPSAPPPPPPAPPQQQQQQQQQQRQQQQQQQQPRSQRQSQVGSAFFAVEFYRVFESTLFLPGFTEFCFVQWPQKKVEVTVSLGFTEFLGNRHVKVLDYWVLSIKKQKDCVLPGFTEFCFVQWA